MESIQDLHNLGNTLEDFVYKNDLKRKHEEDQVPTVQSPKKARTVNCLDYDHYLARVGSFTDSCWSTNVLTSSCPLLPQHLARHGWVAKTQAADARFVQCNSCRECLYLKLPDVTSSTYRSMLARQEARVTSGHAEFCPWSSSPSPADWARPLTNTQEIRQNMTKLMVYGTELPWIRDDLMVKFEEVVEAVTGDTKTVTGDQRVSQSAAVLAALGWQRGELEDTITDMFRVRRLGLWNFVSIQQELDRVEDLRVARELSGHCPDDDLSPKKKDVEGKKYLDPLAEHLPWNPVVVKDSSGRAGWESEKISAESESESGQKESDSAAQAVLNRVRALMELW